VMLYKTGGKLNGRGHIGYVLRTEVKNGKVIAINTVEQQRQPGEGGVATRDGQRRHRRVHQSILVGRAADPLAEGSDCRRRHRQDGNALVMRA
jgi:hypothetical protein